MKQKNILSLALSFIFLISSTLLISEEPQEVPTVNWFTIEEAAEKIEEEPRKVFVHIYTDWCGFCRRIENEAFKHPVIVEILNENYYPVKLDAEQDEPINFKGDKFINENPGKRRSAHNFAIALLRGQLSYPSMAFFNEDLKLISAIPGYRGAKDVESMLMFFYNEEYYKTKDLDGYMKNYEGRVND